MILVLSHLQLLSGNKLLQIKEKADVIVVIIIRFFCVNTLHILMCLLWGFIEISTDPKIVSE